LYVKNDEIEGVKIMYEKKVKYDMYEALRLLKNMEEFTSREGWLDNKTFNTQGLIINEFLDIDEEIEHIDWVKNEIKHLCLKEGRDFIWHEGMEDYFFSREAAKEIIFTARCEVGWQIRQLFQDLFRAVCDDFFTEFINKSWDDSKLIKEICKGIKWARI
jgi:hypothetical protein